MVLHVLCFNMLGFWRFEYRNQLLQQSSVEIRNQRKRHAARGTLQCQNKKIESDMLTTFENDRKSVNFEKYIWSWEFV